MSLPITSVKDIMITAMNIVFARLEMVHDAPMERSEIQIIGFPEQARLSFKGPNFFTSEVRQGEMVQVFGERDNIEAAFQAVLEEQGLIGGTIMSEVWEDDDFTITLVITSEAADVPVPHNQTPVPMSAAAKPSKNSTKPTSPPKSLKPVPTSLPEPVVSVKVGDVIRIQGTSWDGWIAKVLKVEDGWVYVEGRRGKQVYNGRTRMNRVADVVTDQEFPSDVPVDLAPEGEPVPA